MSTAIEGMRAGGDEQLSKSPARAIRVHLATVLATAALFLAIACVVYGPGFATEKAIMAQQPETPTFLAVVGAALRQQSPECLLQSC